MVGFEVTLVIVSTLFLLAQITIQAGLLNADTGMEFNASPRDKEPDIGVMAGRAKRMLANFLETWPAFIALGLATAILDTSTLVTQAGALLYLVGRMIYVPLYLFGVPYVRSLIWTMASAGLVMMAVGLLI